MIENMPILGGIRIPIPPHLVGPALLGLSIVSMVLGLLLFLCLIHGIVTKKKAVFGPESRITMKGGELIKELLTTALSAVASIALSIFCFWTITSGEAEEPSTRKVNDPFAIRAPANFNHSIPRPGRRH